MKKYIALCLLSLFIAFGADAEVIGQRVNLFDLARRDVYGKTPAKIHSENLKMLAKFVSDENTDTDDAMMRPKNLNPIYASEVLQAAEVNPVVSLHAYDKYDPDNVGIGFCFGRAMFVHLDLAYRNFDRDSIRKAFVIGPMQTPDGGSWGWHVTTIAQSRYKRGREVWLAIDPIAGVLNLEKWYNTMRDSYSTDKELKIYITLPTRLGPHPSPYNEVELRNTFYHKYFVDMMDWFGNQAAAGAYNSRHVVEYTGR